MRRPIVHIRPARLEEGAGGLAEQLLAAMPTEVEVCGDVYRGLARLLRREGGPPRAVVVCVEDLGPAEMEFFSITARLLRDTPVYVYGDVRFAERVRRAIELGAAGEATEEVIRRLDVGSDEATKGRSDEGAEAVGAVAAVPPPAESPDTRAYGAGPGIGEVPREPIREPGHTELSRTGLAGDALAGDGLGEDLSVSVGDDEPAGPSADEGDARGGAGRVPWLRYGDRPVRKPPPRYEAEPPRNVREAGKRPAALRGPLLTEEELRALIGDDIASIAPEPVDESEASESSEEERPS